MTSTTPPQPNNFRPPLKVVPPQPKTPEPSTTATPQSSPQFTFPWRRYLMMGGLFCGLGLVSLVNVGNSVPGSVEVDSTPKSRDTVYMQIPGIIKQVLVEPNALVKFGDPLVKIESDELTKEIEELELRIAEAQTGVSRIQESLEPLKAELNIAKLDELATRQKAETLQAELHQITSSNPPPRILMIESEIAGLQTEKAKLTESLEVVQDKFSRLEVVVNAGAAAVNQLDQPLLERQSLERQMSNAESQIRTKNAQIQAIRLEMEKDLSYQLALVEQKAAATQKALERIQETTQEVTNRTLLAEQLRENLQRVKAKQQHLLLTAKTSGVVITNELDKLQSQKLNPGTKILEIVDDQQLTAIVQIDQEDKPLVQLGADVRFFPRDLTLEPYIAKVERIDPIVRTNATGKPYVNVYINVENRDRGLKPGETGFAKIISEPMPIYQKTARELRKLFPRGKWQSPIGM